MKNITPALTQNRHLFLLGIVCSLLMAVSFSIAPSAQAQNICLDEGEDEKQATSFILPYVYASEQLGAVLGVGGVSNGYLQPQATAGGAVQGTSNGSYGLYLGGINYQMPFPNVGFLTHF